jgi:hypothetical protein
MAIDKALLDQLLAGREPQVTADNQAERAATIRMRKRHWGRTVGLPPMALGFFEA